MATAPSTSPPRRRRRIRTRRPGTRIVGLKVTDSRGASSITTKAITAQGTNLALNRPVERFVDLWGGVRSGKGRRREWRHTLVEPVQRSAMAHGGPGSDVLDQRRQAVVANRIRQGLPHRGLVRRRGVDHDLTAPRRVTAVSTTSPACRELDDMCACSARRAALVTVIRFGSSRSTAQCRRTHHQSRRSQRLDLLPPGKWDRSLRSAAAPRDAEDGPLPASALSWSLVLQHCPSTCHTHAVQSWQGVSDGSFTAPDHDYPTYLELTLTATDSARSHRPIGRAARSKDRPARLSDIALGPSDHRERGDRYDPVLPDSHFGIEQLDQRAVAADVRNRDLRLRLMVRRGRADAQHRGQCGTRRIPRPSWELRRW